MKRDTEKTTASEIFYPDTDGELMSDNEANNHRMTETGSVLRRAIERLGIEAHASYNLMVYPVEGDPRTKCTPDVFVAPGCPPGLRYSFKCWEEPGKIELAVEFLSPLVPERIEDEEIQRRIARYRDELGTREVLLYEPQGLDFEDGFRFAFLRLDKDGVYRRVPPRKDGWYASKVLPIEIRPINERIEVRDARTHEVYLPAEIRAQQAERETERADQAERRVRELEAELERLKQNPPRP